MPMLLSNPITYSEHLALLALGRRLQQARVIAGVSRRVLADSTGLNSQTIYRIERGLRRTRRRTLQVVAAILSDNPAAFTEELVSLAGKVLAKESSFAARIEARRLRRLRRIAALEERARYWAERRRIEAEWAERTERHVAFRGWMRSFDLAFRVLQDLGEIPRPSRRSRRRWR